MKKLSDSVGTPRKRTPKEQKGSVLQDVVSDKKSAVTDVLKEKVSPEHRVLEAIKKYSLEFAGNEKAIELLNGMKVKGDELTLIDGTIVKIGYPDVEANNKEIFRHVYGDGVEAVSFKNKKDFEKYCEEMKGQGFRIAGIKDDIYGNIFIGEMTRIFDMIPGKGTPNYNTIIVDILGRSFAGYHQSNRQFKIMKDEVGFWSCSHYLEYQIWACDLNRKNSIPTFSINIRDGSYGALFFKNPGKS